MNTIVPTTADTNNAETVSPDSPPATETASARKPIGFDHLGSPPIPTIRIELTSSQPALGKSKVAAVIAKALREEMGSETEILILNRSADFNRVSNAVAHHGIGEGRVDAERVMIVDWDNPYEEPEPESPLQVFRPDGR